MPCAVHTHVFHDLHVRRSSSVVVKAGARATFGVLTEEEEEERAEHAVDATLNVFVAC